MNDYLKKKRMKEVREDLSESSGIEIIALFYYLDKEGVMKFDKWESDKFSNLMFSALLARQLTNELPGPLNPADLLE